MTQGARILIVDDEPRIRHFMRASLRAHGYDLIEVGTGSGALEQAPVIRPDVLIIDLGLPDMDGVDVIRSIREWSNLPIIVLSVRAREQDKIAALDAGADDYLTKPFGVGELLAHVRVALRHISPTQEPIFQTGELRVDLARRFVTVSGNEVKLTPTEYAILKFLILHAGKVVTHQQLLREVRGTSHPNEAHYIRVFVRQLREKLEENPAHPRYILTETGIGYRIHTEEMN